MPEGALANEGSAEWLPNAWEHHLQRSVAASRYYMLYVPTWRAFERKNGGRENKVDRGSDARGGLRYEVERR